MGTERTKILLKITGSILRDNNDQLNSNAMRSVAQQIAQLLPTHQIGIVIGGGSFFRGKTHTKPLGISPIVGHQVGMLATIMNGLIIQDILEQENIATTLLCANESGYGSLLNQQAINQAICANKVIIFTGGTGNPFFSTDTTAIIRCLQLGATTVWKATNVDGVFEQDPRLHPQAARINEISPRNALVKGLGIIDATALILAQDNNVTIRVFNIFAHHALLHASRGTIGTIIA